MRKILIFSGTTEGKELARRLAADGIPCTVCVATEYGRLVMPELSGVDIHTGRMTEDVMEQFMVKTDYATVVDATHPFAVEVSSNIKAASGRAGLCYMRLKRDTTDGVREQMDNPESFSVKNRYFADVQACAEALAETDGNILLTTGSKELSVFCRDAALRERLYVRVLPGMESLALCEKAGIAGKHIIAMQGPFSREMNEALIRQFAIRCLVTKESGRTGGYDEKLSAAEACEIPVYIIQNPEKNGGMTEAQVYEKIKKLLDMKHDAKEHAVNVHEAEKMAELPEKICRASQPAVALVGIGMGNPDTLTVAAKEVIAHADIVFGAKRLLALADQKAETYPYYLAKDILPHLKTLAPGSRAVILFSGDTGFYSGCSKMQKQLAEAGYQNVSVYPGISSVSYFSAKTGESWHDAKIMSIHGCGDARVWKSAVVEAVRYHAKTFLLTSGVSQVRELGTLLLESGLGLCRIWTGYALSYPEECIRMLTPEQCSFLEQEGLYVCLICNPDCSAKPVTHGWKDDVFLRERVPMTKEEVREVSISKLKLHEGAVVYDIGSGTGSIAMETADRSSSIFVYAIEKKHEAVELIRANQKKFALYNMEVIEALAPEGFEELEQPTHAFIGGSSGNLKEILEALFRKNPKVRVVINAVSLETISEITQLIKDGVIQNPDIVWVQASRAKELGAYHLMQAENPVMIVSFAII